MEPAKRHVQQVGRNVLLQLHLCIIITPKSYNRLFKGAVPNMAEDMAQHMPMLLEDQMMLLIMPPVHIQSRLPMSDR